MFGACRLKRNAAANPAPLVPFALRAFSTATLARYAQYITNQHNLRARHRHAAGIYQHLSRNDGRSDGIPVLYLLTHVARRDSLVEVQDCAYMFKTSVNAPPVQCHKVFCTAHPNLHLIAPDFSQAASAGRLRAASYGIDRIITPLYSTDVAYRPRP